MENVFKNLRENAESRRVPIMSKPTEQYLRSQLLERKPKCCLEIGSAIGYSTLFLASIMQERNGQVISYEVSYPAYLEALMHIKDAHIWNITLYPFDILTTDVRKLVPEKCDLLFVDGQKNQYGAYLEKIEEIKAENSLIIIDDVIKYHDKLTSLYEYLSKKQINYEILPMEEGDGIMVILT